MKAIKIHGSPFRTLIHEGQGSFRVSDPFCEMSQLRVVLEMGSSRLLVLYIVKLTIKEVKCLAMRKAREQNAEAQVV